MSQEETPATEDQSTSNWVKVSDVTGRTYFWNPKTDESVWELPDDISDSGDVAEDSSNLNQHIIEPETNKVQTYSTNLHPHLKPLSIPDADLAESTTEAEPSSLSTQQTSPLTVTNLPDYWQKVTTERNQTFYWNKQTNETQWHPPTFKNRHATLQPMRKRSSSLIESPKLPQHSRSISAVQSPLPSVPTIQPSTNKKGNPLGWKEKMKKYVKERGAAQGIKDFVCELDIGLPFNVAHHVNVKFDPTKVQYSGVPLAWRQVETFPETVCQFGVALNSCPRVKVEGYTERIPAVLVMLQNTLLNFNGLQAEGIFRVAPDGEECKQIRSLIDNGRGITEEKVDPHVAANLIKQFFRELRPNLLNCLSRDDVMVLSGGENGEIEATEERMKKDCLKIPEPNRSAFLWLLDLLCQVAQNERRNRMTVKNLAIVLAPNLFSSENQTPMEALVLSQKTAALVTRFLAWRKERNEKSLK